MKGTRAMKCSCPLRLTALLLGTLALVACGSDYPSAPPGRVILGSIDYEGGAHRSMARPALVVYAFSSWPPMGPPHASHLYEDPDFVDGPFPYELPNLAPHEYVVLAQLADLADEDSDAPVAGGYPDFCSFAYSPLTVGNEAVSDADFQLYDESGNADPCADPSQRADPEPGKAALALQVIAPGMDYEAEEADRLSLVLFGSWPAAGPPLGFTQVAGADIDFPVTLINNRVEPGSYAILVCLDLGGDTMMCDGQEDMQVVFEDGALVAFEEGQIVSIRGNLVTGESERLE